MFSPCNVKCYIPELKKCSEEDAEKMLNEIATFFYRLGINDENLNKSQ